MKEIVAIVEKNENIGGNYHVLTLRLPKKMEAPRPGNFLMIGVNAEPSILLRRPMAFFDVQSTKTKTTAKILYASVGRGTEALTRVKVKDEVRALAPLGNSFSIPKKSDRYLVVAGGIGVAPFLFWYHQLTATQKKQARFVFGFRNKDQAKATKAWKGVKPTVILDEKTKGFPQGNVMHIVPNMADSFQPTHILTCGPNIMMQKVAEFAKSKNIPCEVSLEAKMGCGMGVCLSCVTDFPGVGTADDRVLLCQQGPIFTL